MPQNTFRGRVGLLALLVLFLVSLGACEGVMSTREDFLPDDDEYNRGTPIFVPDFDAVWERGKQAAASEHYSLNDDMTSYTRKEIVTRWITQLAPSRFHGRRRRAVVRFHKVDQQKWVVEVSVQSQRNADINDPLNPADADWEDQPPDKARAEILLWKIESGFKTPGKISDEK